MIIVLFKNTLPHIFYSFSGLNHCITSVLGKQVPKRNFSSPYPPRKRLVGRFWGVYSPFLNSSTNRSLKACDGRILTVICPSGTVSHHLRIVFGSSPVSL
ncbi:hypothetical protein CBW42_13940 [Butyricicoccus porcorum]|uniref:Uncharacterized protein n=1 Tax=Butyricicoccus porcorum TaxID=1945634 RepID=A0A252F0G2_9FIRM|nr:hypothetical protein CBW42_13980 [Butyricicoccus porcorum]OUM19298.1 hypothetical protein CBW42_14075 [Butyricicoccus porcorum]OUM19306.1 hypothetical protein CBW42_13940 [Butyricicoccus porcorum]